MNRRNNTPRPCPYSNRDASPLTHTGRALHLVEIQIRKVGIVALSSQFNLAGFSQMGLCNFAFLVAAPCGTTGDKITIS